MNRPKSCQGKNPFYQNWVKQTGSRERPEALVNINPAISNFSFAICCAFH
ncbi:MAG: hypothetical protein Q8P24_02235 [Desulfobacterales bacterium]|nr:hypothetical protein [Desulfobacterales bacterium]